MICLCFAARTGVQVLEGQGGCRWGDVLMTCTPPLHKEVGAPCWTSLNHRLEVGPAIGPLPADASSECFHSLDMVQYRQRAVNSNIRVVLQPAFASARAQRYPCLCAKRSGQPGIERPVSIVAEAVACMIFASKLLSASLPVDVQRYENRLLSEPGFWEVLLA